jgi:hypothetical protein
MHAARIDRSVCCLFRSLRWNRNLPNPKVPLYQGQTQRGCAHWCLLFSFRLAANAFKSFESSFCVSGFFAQHEPGRMACRIVSPLSALICACAFQACSHRWRFGTGLICTPVPPSQPAIADFVLHGVFLLNNFFPSFFEESSRYGPVIESISTRSYLGFGRARSAAGSEPLSLRFWSALRLCDLDCPDAAWIKAAVLRT